MPHLAAIAQALGISESSVSRALRHLPGVSKKTIARVEAEAERQGYRPNPYVSLMMAHMRRAEPIPYAATLAWIDTLPRAEMWHNIAIQREFFRGAQARALALGYSVERLWAFEPGMTPERLMEVLRARGINGVLLPDTPEDLRHHGDLVIDPARFAVATVGFRSEAPALNFSANDQYTTARNGHRKLREFGYRRVGFLTKRFVEDVVDYRFSAGYLALAAEDPAITPLPIFFADFPKAKEFSRWLKDAQPDAILATWMPEAAWLRESAGAATKSIGWATLDWDPTQPEIAGIEQMHARVGAAAVDLVVGQLHRNEIGIPANVQGSLIEGEWHDGASLPPPRRPARTQRVAKPRS